MPLCSTFGVWIVQALIKRKKRSFELVLSFPDHDYAFTRNKMNWIVMRKQSVLSEMEDNDCVIYCFIIPRSKQRSLWWPSYLITNSRGIEGHLRESSRYPEIRNLWSQVPRRSVLGKKPGLKDIADNVEENRLQVLKLTPLSGFV